MLRLVGSLGALLLGMSVMLLSNGLFATLTALRMTIENFSPVTIGVVVACHSVGFATACLTCGRIIRRVGHIRVFAALASMIQPAQWMRYYAASSTQALKRSALIFSIVLPPSKWA